ncbi:MAG TPA: GreA/GreB family elongation factor [Herminiimonas sp.]|nr:GreA/GreB family elongation factor [Herminiimonas sp.]
MSKAFTRESDTEEELSPLPEMPTGVRNYITPAGYLALQEALRALTEQPAVASDLQVDQVGEKTTLTGSDHRARDIDQHVRYLRARIDSAEVVDPAVHAGNDQIFFGATVTYRDESDDKHVVTIVGLDELDLANGRISWLSPVAQALLNAHEGDTVELDGPAGLTQLKIIAVAYPQSDPQSSG